MMNRAIRWDIIAEQYDQMIRYATAIRTGATSTEAILRRFTKASTREFMAAPAIAQRSTPPTRR
jgi:TnpA family transposase